jgi:hypothetical protein
MVDDGEFTDRQPTATRIYDSIQFLPQNTASSSAGRKFKGAVCPDTIREKSEALIVELFLGIQTVISLNALRWYNTSIKNLKEERWKTCSAAYGYLDSRQLPPR